MAVNEAGGRGLFQSNSVQVHRRRSAPPQDVDRGDAQPGLVLGEADACQTEACTCETPAAESALESCPFRLWDVIEGDTRGPDIISVG